MNVFYKGKIIHKNLSEEDLLEVLLDLAEKSYEGKLNKDDIELKETVE
jgi:hypothetical protein